MSPRAVEAQALREELAAAREAARCDEAAALGAELEGLRAELLRLADENRRLQSTPKVPMRTVVQSASRWRACLAGARGASFGCQRVSVKGQASVGTCASGAMGSSLQLPAALSDHTLVRAVSVSPPAP